jgi:hypothetical protein
MNYDLILDRVFKIFGFIKQSKEAFIVYSDGKINKAATFWKVIFTSIIISLSFLMPIFMVGYQIRKVSAIDYKVSKDIDRILNQCGFNSYLFWSVVDGNKVTFKNTSGCINKTENCISHDIKLDNPIYQNLPLLDPNTIFLLEKTQEGQFKKFTNLEEMYQFDALYKIFSKTNLPMDEVGFVVVKGIQGDIIYVFSLYFVKGSPRNCQYPWLMLQDFGLKVKGYL